MYIIDNIKNLKNHTIAFSNTCIDEVIIVTTDGGILYMEIDGVLDMNHITDLSKCLVALNGYQGAMSLLLKDKVISQLEIDEAMEEQRKTEKAKQDKIERQELQDLARLKAKYENNNGLPI